MRFLGVLGLGLVDLGMIRQRLGAEVTRDQLAHLGHGVFGKRHRVGTHIGDQADIALATRAIRLRTNPARCFMVRLVEKPSLRAASCCKVEVVNGGAGRRLRSLLPTSLTVRRPWAASFSAARAAIASCSLVRSNCSNFLPFNLVRRAVKSPSAWRSSASTVQYSRATKASISSSRSDDHAQGGALHAAGRKSALHLAPKHRREVEADQVVQRTARLLGVDHVMRKLARLGHGGLDRLGRDLGEHHAVQVLALGQATLLQDLADVPGDRLAFAIQVGREIDVVGQLGGLGDGVDVLLVALDHLVVHGEAMLGIDRPLLRLEVTHVTVGGQDVEVLAEVFVDRLRLGRRLDDEQVFCHVTRYPPSMARPVRAGLYI